LKETRIVDDQYHIEHVYENPDTVTRSSLPAPAPTPANQPSLPWKGPYTDSHPKVSWGVRVTLETYDFIKAHDGIRLRLKDKRIFKEKLLDWLNELKTEVEAELETPPPPSSNNGKSGTKPGEEATQTL
jgi:hypothetical protein